MIVLCWLVDLVAVVFVARVVLGWVPPPRSGWGASVADAVFQVTEPVLAPVRVAVPPVRVGATGIDLAPVAVVLALAVLGAAVC